MCCNDMGYRPSVIQPERQKGPGPPSEIRGERSCFLKAAELGQSRGGVELLMVLFIAHMDIMTKQSGTPRIKQLAKGLDFCISDLFFGRRGGRRIERESTYGA